MKLTTFRIVQLTGVANFLALLLAYLVWIYSGGTIVLMHDSWCDGPPAAGYCVVLSRPRPLGNP